VRFGGCGLVAVIVVILVVVFKIKVAVVHHAVVHEQVVRFIPAIRMLNMLAHAKQKTKRNECNQKYEQDPRAFYFFGSFCRAI
jgi:hypothetical protein